MNDPIKDIIDIINLGGATSGGNTAKDTVQLWAFQGGLPIAATLAGAFIWSWPAVATVATLAGFALWAGALCISNLAEDYQRGRKQIQEWKNSP